MTAQKRQSLIAAFAPLLEWFKANLAVIIAFLSLSWQISSKVGPAAYSRVSNFIDSAEMTRQRSWQLQRELSAFKVEQSSTDHRQDSSINKLISKN